MASGTMQKSSEMDRYVDIEFKPTGDLAAGTIGTRAWQGTYNLGTNIVPKSVLITFIGDSSKILPIVFSIPGNSTIYCNIYRCISGAIGMDYAKVNARVYY